MSSSAVLPPPSGRGRALPVAAVKAPPFPLVGAHFAAGLAWALLGAAGLTWLAPQLAQGNFLDPRVLALTHTFTLGFLTTVIMGVLYQIYPAMLGVAPRSLRVAWYALVLQTAGTAALVAGLFTGERTLLGCGWSLLFLATFGVAWNILPGRRRAQRNKQIGAYVSYAHTAFGFAMAIGLARIGDGFGWWTTPRLALLAAHFQFAAVGFGGLTAMGVGSRMLPMFFGTPQEEDVAFRWIPRIILSGTVVFALGALRSLAALQWAGAVLMALGTLLFLRLAQGWYAGSPVKGRDGALRLMITALGAMAASIPLGFAALEAGLRQPGLLAAYPVVVVLGWLGGLILGVSYRILPNLAWQHLYASARRNPGVPGLRDIVSPRIGAVASWSFLAGMLLLVPALVLGGGAVARAGASLVLAAVLLTWVHHLRLLRPRQAVPANG